MAASEAGDNMTTREQKLGITPRKKTYRNDPMNKGSRNNPFLKKYPNIIILSYIAFF
jgi:hypothetical protein